jgi:sec-independent protein translocase protein TatA
MGGLGMRELLIILLVVLVVFGAKKLRTVGSDLGAAVKGFKKAMSEGDEEQSAAQKQIRSEKPDAEFDEAAKKTDASSKSERSV